MSEPARVCSAEFVPAAQAAWRLRRLLVRLTSKRGKPVANARAELARTIKIDVATMSRLMAPYIITYEALRAVYVKIGMRPPKYYEYPTRADIASMERVQV